MCKNFLSLDISLEIGFFIHRNSNMVAKGNVFFLIWSGSATTGQTLTITRFKDFSLFLIGNASYPVALIGCKFAESFHAYGMDSNASNGYRLFSVRGTYTDTTLKITSAYDTMLTYGGNFSSRGSFTITSIMGIV